MKLRHLLKILDCHTDFLPSGKELLAVYSKDKRLWECDDWAVVSSSGPLVYMGRRNQGARNCRNTTNLESISIYQTFPIENDTLKQLLMDSEEFVNRKCNPRILQEERLRVRLNRAVERLIS